MSHPASLASAWERVSQIERSGDTCYTSEHMAGLKNWEEKKKIHKKKETPICCSAEFVCVFLRCTCTAAALTSLHGSMHVTVCVCVCVYVCVCVRMFQCMCVCMCVPAAGSPSAGAVWPGYILSSPGRLVSGRPQQDSGYRSRSC